MALSTTEGVQMRTLIVVLTVGALLNGQAAAGPDQGASPAQVHLTTIPAPAVSPEDALPDDIRGPFCRRFPHLCVPIHESAMQPARGDFQ